MFDHLLESSRWDDSNKWSNIEIGEELGILETEIRTLSRALITYEAMGQIYIWMKLPVTQTHFIPKNNFELNPEFDLTPSLTYPRFKD